MTYHSSVTQLYTIKFILLLFEPKEGTRRCIMSPLCTSSGCHQFISSIKRFGGNYKLRNNWVRGVKLKTSKCTFCQEVVFLDHTVSEEGVSTDPANVQVITSWPAPSKFSNS